MKYRSYRDEIPADGWQLAVEHVQQPFKFYENIVGCGASVIKAVEQTN